MKFSWYKECIYYGVMSHSQRDTQIKIKIGFFSRDLAPSLLTFFNVRFFFCGKHRYVNNLWESFPRGDSKLRLKKHFLKYCGVQAVATRATFQIKEH